MHEIADLDDLEKLRGEGALFVLFGGQDCNVCHSVRRPLAVLVDERFPQMRAVYIDCTKSPDICAQNSVFSLPAVKVYIDGSLVVEDARAFSLAGLIQRIERAYEVWVSETGR